jgi:phenylalanyl-tRNA synthetase beta chain
VCSSDLEISAATTDVLLEAARFEPRSIRRTSRAHQLASDSSYRFERGVDPELTDWASRRVCGLIIELAGGTLLDGSFDIRADPTCTPEVTLRLARLKLVLGIEVPRGEVERILRGLELETVRHDAASITVRVPSWRGDLRREIDLIEEVARIYGYDKIGETTQMPVRGLAPSTQEMAERRARHLLAGQGFCEVMNYSLISPTALQRAQPWCDGQPVAVRNPVTVERTHLRLTHMANLLQVKEFNADRGTPQAAKTRRIGWAKLAAEYWVAGSLSGKPQSQAGPRRSLSDASRWMATAVNVAEATMNRNTSRPS